MFDRQNNTCQRDRQQNLLSHLRQFVSALILIILSATVLAAPAVPALLLAETDRGKADVRHYLVSEKLDGVRAYWDGQQLNTRSGLKIEAPSWFIDAFPKRALDGELWMGRQQFDNVSAAVRRQTPNDAEWHEIKYMLFELPDAEGSFRERVQQLQKIVDAAKLPWLQLIDQQPIEDRHALHKKLTRVVNAGGEGLVLHLADAPYRTGRSDVLLKLKPWHDDEAVVIAHMPGKGKYQGMTGALRVRLANGKVFLLGSGLSDALRHKPPAIGSTITFRYHELNANGIPRFARFYRIRDTWEINPQ